MCDIYVGLEHPTNSSGPFDSILARASTYKCGAQTPLNADCSGHCLKSPARAVRHHIVDVEQLSRTMPGRPSAYNNVKVTNVNTMPLTGIATKSPLGPSFLRYVFPYE